jgi:hypothetical protein
MSPRSLRSPIHPKVTVAIVRCVEMIELLFLNAAPERNDQSHQVMVATSRPGRRPGLFGEVPMNSQPSRRWPRSNLLISR